MTETVLVIGAGASKGVGGALARRFAGDGRHVVIAGRTQDKVDALAAEVKAAGGSAEGFRVDVTSEADQDALFAYVAPKGPIAAVLYNAGNNAIIPFEDVSPEQFETFWRVGCFGGFLTAKRAMPLLAAQGRGSMFFTGASASLRGKANFAHFASMKGALRNLAQSLAREYGPKGVHVAHVIIHDTHQQNTGITIEPGANRIQMRLRSHQRPNMFNCCHIRELRHTGTRDLMDCFAC